MFYVAIWLQACRIEDVHIFKHCREMTGLLLWIGTYFISCVVQQTSGVKDLSSLVSYDDSSLGTIRHVQSIIPRSTTTPKYTLPQRLVFLTFPYPVPVPKIV